MRRMLFSAALICAIFSTLLIKSCVPPTDEQPSELYGYEAEYMTREQLGSSVKLLPARAMNATGKIYVKDDYLVIVEPSRGLHIFNNSDPSNPKALKFIEVPGINDVAIKDDLFCVDNIVDLVFFRYDFNNQITSVQRMENFLPEPLPPGYRTMPMFIRPSANHIVVRWIKK